MPIMFPKSKGKKKLDVNVQKFAVSKFSGGLYYVVVR